MKENIFHHCSIRFTSAHSVLHFVYKNVNFYVTINLLFCKIEIIFRLVARLYFNCLY